MEVREIKFRAWDGHFRKMDYGGGDLLLRAKENPVMQFTGLHDKNGKEIYEGDVIAAKLNTPYIQRVGWKGEPDVIAHVFWSFAGFELRATNDKDSRYCDMLDFIKSNQEDLLMMERTESEIIGNIYENPDLIKK